MDNAIALKIRTVGGVVRCVSPYEFFDVCLALKFIDFEVGAQILNEGMWNLRELTKLLRARVVANYMGWHTDQERDQVPVEARSG
jgi:hypothetical protein